MPEHTTHDTYDFEPRLVVFVESRADNAACKVILAGQEGPKDRNLDPKVEEEAAAHDLARVAAGARPEGDEEKLRNRGCGEGALL